MKTKSPPERHRFADEWDEIDYLYHKLLYWLYERGSAERARQYADQLERILPKADPQHEAILGEECWSLLHEAKGDMRNAIHHRQNEIRLIRRLYDISQGKSYQRIALKDYGYDDLSDRLELLAILYHDSGQLEKALDTLEDAKKMCIDHGIPFDSENLLREYSEERPSHTLFLWVSENGALTAREASTGFQVATPSTNVARIERLQDPNHQTEMSPPATQRNTGEGTIAIED